MASLVQLMQSLIKGGLAPIDLFCKVPLWYRTLYAVPGAYSERTTGVIVVSLTKDKKSKGKSRRSLYCSG